jgi:hypothetical protein
MGEERRVTVLKNGVNVGCNLFVAPQRSGAELSQGTVFVGILISTFKSPMPARLPARCLSPGYPFYHPPTARSDPRLIVQNTRKPGPIVDPQFRDAGTNRPNVARVSKAQSINSSLYAAGRARLEILQTTP